MLRALRGRAPPRRPARRRALTRARSLAPARSRASGVAARARERGEEAVDRAAGIVLVPGRTGYISPADIAASPHVRFVLRIKKE